ncbi:MAG: hypothetical protein M3T49_05485, partial [Candidatus Eremiobacteraeota bacterium]|nr:hypothetical protein [Candidatus Eremiobacteraeota bacterium]
MRRTGKKNAALAAGLLLVILLAVGVGLEGPRSAIVRSGLSIYLNTRGLHLQRGDLRLGGGELRARDLVIAERNGPTLFSAAALRVRYSFHGTSAAIEAVDVQRPYLAVRREANGTFNLTNLFGTGPAGPAGPAKQGPPMRMRVTVRDGRVDMLNPTSPLPIARGFTLSGLNVNALIDQGRRSHGDLAAVISAAGVARPLRAVFVENDLTRLGTISAHVTDVPLAPIVDLLVNTPAFVVEHGRADVAIEVYALGWAEAAGPAWQVSADIALRDGALKVVPLLVPARELSGKLHYSGGSLSLDGVTGTAAGVPLLALGSLQILPSARLAVRVDAQGPAERVRKLLAFSRSLPLGGTLALQARVSGPVTNPHVRVGFVSAAGLRFGGGPAAPVAGTLYYHHGHVTLTDVAADYAG